MLICQCNAITDREITRVVLAMLREDPWKIIVPAMVYKALGQRYKCSGCVPNVVDIVIKVTQEYHLEMTSDPAQVPPVPQRLSAMRRKASGGRSERRTTGHRTAK